MNATQVLDRPDKAGPGGYDFDHLYCCDPDKALCGADAEEFNECGDCDHDICALCLLAEDTGQGCVC